MNSKLIPALAFAAAIVASHVLPSACAPAVSAPPGDPDERVRRFLEEERRNWRDMNVPYADGRILHDLIVKNNYKSVLEIGTSTGLSAVWIAWALRKTGGKLTTIEIDRRRYDIARRNFERAGLVPQIEAVLGDAHKLVYARRGPYDLVFVDADKDWYIKYFEATHPHLRRGGIFAAHNVLNTGMRGIPEFVAFVRARKDYATRIDRSSRAGISISRKL